MSKYFSIIFSQIWVYCVWWAQGKNSKASPNPFHFPPSTKQSQTSFFSQLFSPLFFIPPIITSTTWGLKSTQARIKVFFTYLIFFFQKTNTHTHTRERKRFKVPLDRVERRENLITQQNVLVAKGFTIMFYFILFDL